MRIKTATLEDLRTNLDTIIGWVEQGEDVVVKGRKPASEIPKQSVDRSKSTAFRCREGEPVLTGQDLDELFEEMRGPY